MRKALRRAQVSSREALKTQQEAGCAEGTTDGLRSTELAGARTHKEGEAFASPRFGGRAPEGTGGLSLEVGMYYEPAG